MRLGLRNIGLDPDRDVNLRVVGATNLRMIMMQQGQAQFSVFSNTRRNENHPRRDGPNEARNLEIRRSDDDRSEHRQSDRG